MATARFASGLSVEDFIKRKHGKEPIKYLHPGLEQVLRETYGVIVYQEQVMQAAQKMAGYTLGGADLLRRAMGKKKPEEMEQQKSIFLDGALANGHADADASDACADAAAVHPADADRAAHQPARRPADESAGGDDELDHRGERFAVLAHGPAAGNRERLGDGAEEWQLPGRC